VIRFLFWNLHKKPLEARIASLARHHDIDMLMLAECVIPVGRMLSTLSDATGRVYHRPPSECESLSIYTRFPAECVRVLFERPNRLTLRRLALPGRAEVLLALAHLPGKPWSDASQASECRRVVRTIREIEEEMGHSRTLLAGDLNVNPFEEPAVTAEGFHAVAARSVASRGSRVVQDDEYPFFYNPMWGHFGHAIDDPPGTYYYARAEYLCYFWHMIDQVLVRPALLKDFPDDQLRILDSDGTAPLVASSGRPDAANASDHLPITFALTL